MKLECNTQYRYTPDTGEVPTGEQVQCGVCGDAMAERRNVNGPRGFAQAMSGGKSLHDVFECDNRNHDWHKQVVALRVESRKTPSAKLAAIMLLEANDILCNRRATK